MLIVKHLSDRRICFKETVLVQASFCPILILAVLCCSYWKQLLLKQSFDFSELGSDEIRLKETLLPTNSAFPMFDILNCLYCFICMHHPVPISVLSWAFLYLSFGLLDVTAIYHWFTSSGRLYTAWTISSFAVAPTLHRLCVGFTIDVLSPPSAFWLSPASVLWDCIFFHLLSFTWHFI